MSSAGSLVAFALGAGGGVVLWRVLRRRTDAVASSPSPSPRNHVEVAKAPCQLRLTSDGLTADGVPAALTTAIARGAVRGSELLATAAAPAAVWYELVTALSGAGPRRNARKKARRAPRHGKPTNGIDLVRFCDSVAAIAVKVDVETTPDGLVRGRFGPHKVLLAAVRRGLSRTQYRGMTRAQVDAFLVEGMRQGLLQLARADIPAALDAAEVRDSEIRVFNASYHFVISERDQREGSDE